MRNVMLFLILWIATHSTVNASGFGWYMYLFEWESADAALREKVAALKKELVANTQRAEYFQREIDRLATSLCETDVFNEELSAYVRDANPINYEFYSPKTIALLRSGNAHALFERFSEDSERYLVVSPRVSPTDPYVVYSPLELGILAAAIRQFKASDREKGDEYFELQLAQLEASLVFGSSDRLVGASHEMTGIGAIFCGHN